MRQLEEQLSELWISLKKTRIAGNFRGHKVLGFRWFGMYREHLYPQI